MEDTKDEDFTLASELIRFASICRAAWITGRAVVTCSGPGAARRTRQKFYRLRGKLPMDDFGIAQALLFHLNGCQIELLKKANYTSSLESSKDQSHAPSNKPFVT